ncbi:MMPL family transporter [Tessaracoccus antarcticus]|uniref:Membrane transport protein MMPL domain-containing protein n=1 Tax=Tessaracoccus antarcticus TaxID=2479848 RepID=A0A3M0GAL1_9ACTN|nr:MMPL family transporter [Tessaracoccus antarcticus]RMB61468.1 hypothetical protein EAX62_02135 [Tessaracoccus antarcticus]
MASGMRVMRRRVGAALHAAGRATGRTYRWIMTSGRWLVVLGWIAIAVLVPRLIDDRPPATDFGNLVTPENPVVQDELRVLSQFDVPVISGTTVVLHQQGGLGALARADSYLFAASTTQEALRIADPGPDRIIAAIPLPTGRSDTTVTYLFASDQTSPRSMYNLAHDYARHFNNVPEHQTYVTGFIPSQIAQSNYLARHLPTFELASVVLIVVVVALAFRSLLAPIVVLIIAGIGYAVYRPLLGFGAATFGFEVPSQLEPVLLALLLGVVTDYCVLFLEEFRDALDDGLPTRAATEAAMVHQSPIIATAGLTVAGGTLALLAAPFILFRGLGPALALTVVVGVVVSLTLTPAIMAILGWRLFAPLPIARWRTVGHRRPDTSGGLLERQVTSLTTPRRAVVAVVLLLAVFGLLSLPLAAARLDLSFTSSLPADDEVAQGAALLQRTTLRGATAPTEVLVEQDNILNQREQLARLQALISTMPGVTHVVGPVDNPLQGPRGLVLSRNGRAARFIVVLDSDPLADQAIRHADGLQERLPAMAAQAGLTPSYLAVTGQTLIAGEVARQTRESLGIVLVAALVIELLILTFYLKSVITPIVLLATGALSVTATLGLTVLVFQGLLGQQGLTFYAPFASAVLLIALGSDYNVFSVGSIWRAMRHRDITSAVRFAVPRAARAITVAGVILAGTFALVAVIPLATFWQIAFTMSVGLLIDTFVVRPLLTPALLTLLGRWATWPRPPAPWETPAEP